MLRAGIVSLFMLIVAGSTQAQIRGGVTGPWGGINLLLHPEVQKELKLDDGQLLKAKTLAAEMYERGRTLYPAVGGQGDEKTRKMLELASAHVAEGIKKAEAFLNPEQVVRFRQLDLQRRTIAALTDPIVAKSLRLEPDQSIKIQVLYEEFGRSVRDASSKAEGGPRSSKANEKVKAIQMDTETKAFAILTEAQKAEWKRMIGEPLKITSSVHPQNR